MLPLLNEALGPVILAALDDPATQDVMVNPDGAIWLRRQGRMERVGEMSADARMRVLAYAAHLAGRCIRPDAARLSAVLPESRARLKGHIPPLVAAPCFTIRRPAPRLFTVADYVADGTLSAAQARFLERAAGTRNIVFAGPPGGGKTTMANAVLALPAFAARRVVACEDDEELILPANAVRLLTDPDAAPPVGMQHLVADALRMMPDILLIGEVRGPEALDLIMAWNTGLCGVSTVHANSAADTLLRLAQLIAMNKGVVPSRAEIARAVNVVVFIRQAGEQRRVDGIAAVEPDGGDGWRLRAIA